MKFVEAWRLSQVPYREVVYQSLAEEKGRMWWGAFGHSQASDEERIDNEFTNRALRIARFDKTIVSIFNILVAAAPFFALIFGVSVFGLASSVMLSLVVTLGLTTIYAIQTLSSFVSAESSTLLTILPIAKKDFSLITMLTFFRSVDYMVFGSVASQVVLVALLTGSIVATAAMLLIAVVNQVLAVTVALWFSKVLQKNLSYGGRSKFKTALRALFIMLWGLLLVSVGFMFVIPWYTGINFESIFFGLSNISPLLALFYPFSTGAIIANLSGFSVASNVLLLSAFAVAGYSILAVVGIKWSLKTVRGIAQVTTKKTIRFAPANFSIRIRSPILAFISKDIKISSRNPATAFFFVLPVLETVIVALLISNQSVLRTSMLIDATLMGALFALLIPLALLTSEGKGLDYTKTLPITSQKIITSKTLATVLAYSFAPLALVTLAVVKPLMSLSSIFIPCLTIISVASASVFEIRLFMQSIAKSKISAVVNDLQKLVVGAVSVFAPLLMYSVIFLWTFSHYASLLAMAGMTLLEFALAIYLLKRS